ncbi:MAG: MATE family efflux transporter, partial [Butyrivibrio sp.]|nr:MATE family efflux transporter [Butyrivibrio sp.]
SSDAAVIARAAEYLKGFAPEAIVTAILFSFVGYYNGHSKTLFVMLQGLAQTFIVRLPVSYIMSIQPDASLAMIGLAAPCATIFGIVINLLYFTKVSKETK